MESGHFSCDEEDFDTISSVGYPTTLGSCDVDQDDVIYAAEDVETSSQVARSIISGLFRNVTRKEEVLVENKDDGRRVSSRSTKLEFEGSDCSGTAYQIGLGYAETQQTEAALVGNPPTPTPTNCVGYELEDAQPLESPEPVESLEKDGTGSVISLNSSKSCILESESKQSPSGCGDSCHDLQDKMSDLARSNSSFTARITDWINNTSLKERDPKEDTRSVYFQESIHCSTPVETVTMCDGSVYSEDDQPAGYTSPVRSLSDSKDDSMSLQVRDRFQSEARTNISSALVPTTAFTSYDQGFSSVQQSNGKELFDNGLIRHRLAGSYIRSIPFPNDIIPRNYHIKVTETTEQKMKLNKDGSQVIDTTHKREQSEKSFGEDDKNWISFLKIFLLVVCLLLFLSLILVVLLQYLQIVDVQGLNCFMEKSGFFDKFSSNKKAYIEI